MEIENSFLYLFIFTLIIQLFYLFLFIKMILDYYKISDLRIRSLINLFILLSHQINGIVIC